MRQTDAKAEQQIKGSRGSQVCHLQHSGSSTGTTDCR